MEIRMLIALIIILSFLLGLNFIGWYASAVAYQKADEEKEFVRLKMANMVQDLQELGIEYDEAIRHVSLSKDFVIWYEAKRSGVVNWLS